ncbi:Mitochondrial distribution and morphology protein 10 [Spathaspora sp. JA1]|nr:Mitochondrial distribution and morphology protein 10 [Spathaspora sp. JA1]
MEYLQKCFYKSSNWNEDNIFSNITATSQALLEFPLPNGIKVDTSSKSTEYSASSFTLSNFHSINGSLAYLYSSIPLTNTMGTKEVSLQDAIAGFRIIEPSTTRSNSTINNKPISIDRSSLLYGRMYFPGSALEAMIIKRITQYTQVLIKTISNPHLEKNGTMIIYLQNNTPKYSREFIYSTNESLLGFRCLYNFGASQNLNQALIPRFDNSVVSLGTEIWYAARTMSPGMSTAFRYSTRSTSTGKPLTMTLAINPIIGHISSTYTVKTSVASTFCSKYDFNLYSYASNLSLGFELYSYGKSNKFPTFKNHEVNLSSQENNYLRKKTQLKKSPRSNEEVSLDGYKHHNSSVIINPIENQDNVFHINPTLLPGNAPGVKSKNRARLHPQYKNETVTAAFENLVNESDFSSVLKFSTSLNDRMIKLLWEGRLKDFLVSTGVKISLNPTTNIPEFNKLGISFSYAF